MFIGHLPAGYMTARLLLRRAGVRGLAGARFLWAGAIGAIAPDFDLAYFYLVDDRQHHHHAYVTHFPAMWLAAMLVCACWWRWGRARAWASLAGVFAVGGFTHMLLDSIVGDIAWLAPFSDQRFALFEVPGTFKPWWLNFVLHWSFALELVLVASAVYIWRRDHARYW
jgi:inner membrane protein